MRSIAALTIALLCGSACSQPAPGDRGYSSQPGSLDLTRDPVVDGTRLPALVKRKRSLPALVIDSIERTLSEN